MSEQRTVLLGVTGSIAAFKAAKLASDLVQLGFAVRAALSHGATRFIAPLTFEAITANPVAVDVWDELAGTSRMGHLELARWADVLVVAPASAGAIARLALGLTDDMLGAVALASRAPLLLAPAMESAMWQHPATRQNIETLQSRGATLIGPESGRLASGEAGEGRMAEPESIVSAIRGALGATRSMEGVKVLVTAGPTYEAIDPVRFIGNRSSGKMGYAIAEEARSRGARVVLVTGPSALPVPFGLEAVQVESAAEMTSAVVGRAPEMDVIVMAAAIADFRPAAYAEAKIRRSGSLSLDLTPTEDVAQAASRAAPSSIHVGFALESGNGLDRAFEKLRRKGQDLVVFNSVSAEHSPFGSDTERATIISAHGAEELPEMSKREVASKLLDEVASLLERRPSRTG